MKKEKEGVIGGDYTLRGIDDWLQLYVSELERVSDAGMFDRAFGLTDWYERTYDVKELLYAVYRRSSVKMWRGELYIFTGEIYERMPDGLFERGLELYLVRMHIRKRDMTTKIFNMFVSRCMDAVRLYNQLRPRFNIVAFRNGVVDFSTGELHGFSRDYDVLHKNGYDYDPKADCPLWRRFLRMVLPEKESRLILQMYFSLGLLDRGTMDAKVENCLTLFGSGSNGKSVIQDTMRGIFGSWSIAEVSLRELFRDGDEGLRAMSKVDGHKFVFCPDIHPKDLSGNEDRFKSFVSGERQLARRLRGNIYTITNIPFAVFNANELPRSTDKSYGYFRRFLYIVFGNVIPESMQNKSLTSELKSEYPGILNWVVRGGRYLRANKYVFPRSENAERQRLQVMGDSNVTMSWAMARGIRSYPMAKGELWSWINVREMYEDMLKYAEVNDFPTVTPVVFGRRLKDLGFSKLDKVRTSTGYKYKVYGFSREDLSTPAPVVVDMDFKFDEDEDWGKYDERDL